MVRGGPCLSPRRRARDASNALSARETARRAFALQGGLTAARSQCSGGEGKLEGPLVSSAAADAARSVCAPTGVHVRPGRDETTSTATPPPDAGVRRMFAPRNDAVLIVAPFTPLFMDRNAIGRRSRGLSPHAAAGVVRRPREELRAPAATVAHRPQLTTHAVARRRPADGMACQPSSVPRPVMLWWTLLLAVPWAAGFNLDTHFPVLLQGPAGSHFGYSVALHRRPGLGML